MISTKQLFIKFLKDNNVYEQYMFNVNKRKEKYFTPKNFFLNTLYVDFVSNAFTWKETLQGYGYWDKIENNWLYNLRKKGLL